MSRRPQPACHPLGDDGKLLALVTQSQMTIEAAG
jgi:hypothetical protein